MREFALATAVLGSLLAMLEAPPVQAQATRTWVSGVGDDVNPCSRTAPCKTFAGAISKTAANGIINCLDPGGFGGITITKSITIDCEGTLGSILVSGTNGVNVNGAGIVVTLRNLSIEGIGTGLVGVNFVNGAALHVEKCFIHGFSAGAAAGIRMAPTVVAELFVSETSLSENGAGTLTGGGIVVAPTGAGGVRAMIHRVNSRNNSAGIVADGSASTGVGGIRVNIRGSTFTGNSGFGVRALSTGTSTQVTIFGGQVSATDNGLGGVIADGSRSLIVLGDSMITQNVGLGVSTANSGVVTTQRNNQVGSNIGGNGTFTNTFPLQ